MPSLLATGLFTLGIIAGFNFRRLWKAEGPRWKLWLTGAVAGVCLLTVAFIPVSGG